MIITIDEIKSITHRTLHVDTESIRIFLKNGEDVYLSPLIVERSIMNGFGMNKGRYVLPYDTLVYINNYNERGE